MALEFGSLRGSVGGFFSSAAFNKAGIILGYALLLVILLIAAYFFIIRPLSFKVRVLIIARRSGGAPQFAYDRGKYIKKDGVERFILLKRSGFFGKKLTLEPPEYDDLVLGERGQNTLVLEKTGEHDYRPIHVEDVFENSPFKPTDADMKNWLVMEHKLDYQKYTRESFWSKYGSQVMLIGAMALIMIMLWMTLGKVDSISQSLGGASNKMAQAVEDFGKQIVAAR